MEAKTRALVEHMANDSEEAFDELYRLYSVKVYRMAYFITHNPSDSEDVLQETFIKCYLHRKELKQPEQFESWLYQILVRTAWRWEDKKKKKKELSFDEILDDEDKIGNAELIQRDDAAGPLDRLLEKEKSMELWSAVNCLDWKHRTVVLLYYYNELSTREIASMAGTFEGTVKSRLHKARILLRKQLEQERGGETKRGGMCHE